MSGPFLVAAAAGLALCLVFPFLLPFVLLGIVVGVLPALVKAAKRFESRATRPDNHRLRSWAMRGGLALAFASTAIYIAGSAPLHIGSPDPGGSGRLIALPVTYRGEGTYRDNPERLEIVDRLSVALADIRTQAAEAVFLRAGTPPNPAASPVDSSAAFRRLEATLVAELADRGWRLVSQTTASDVFTKDREVTLRSRSLPMDTGNEVPLPPLPRGSGAAMPFVLYLTSGSQLVLTAPTRTFDSTRPESDRVERLVADLEDRTVPVDDVAGIEVDVRSPWFRSGPTSTVAGWALSLPEVLLGLLFASLIAVLSEPIQNWIRRRLGLKKK